MTVARGMGGEWSVANGHMTVGRWGKGGKGSRQEEREGGPAGPPLWARRAPHSGPVGPFTLRPIRPVIPGPVRPVI